MVLEMLWLQRCQWYPTWRGWEELAVWANLQARITRFAVVVRKKPVVGFIQWIVVEEILLKVHALAHFDLNTSLFLGLSYNCFRQRLSRFESTPREIVLSALLISHDKQVSLIAHNRVSRWTE